MTTQDDFRALDATLESMGLRNGTDYRIQGIPMPGLSSGEYIGLRTVENAFQVFYFDSGSLDSLLTTTDFAAARQRMIDEAVDLGASHRHGPKATDPDPSPPWNELMGRAMHPPVDDR